MAKTWQQKFHNGRVPLIETCPSDFGGIPAGAPFLISTPAEIDAWIRALPRGREASLQNLRRDIALSHGVEYMCPLTAGIFLRIVAEKAWEEYTGGSPVPAITPFWRVIGPRTPLARKLSFGTGFIEEMRAAEGIPF